MLFMVDRFFAAAGQTTMKSMAHMKPCKATHQKPESFNFSFPLSGLRFQLFALGGAGVFPLSGFRSQVSGFHFRPGQSTMKSMAHMKPCKAANQKPESFNFSFPFSGFNFMPLMPFMVDRFFAAAGQTTMKHMKAGGRRSALSASFPVSACGPGLTPAMLDYMIESITRFVRSK